MKCFQVRAFCFPKILHHLFVIHKGYSPNISKKQIKNCIYFFILNNAFGMKQLSTPQLHLEWALTFETPCSSSITLHVTLLKKHQYIIIINKTLFPSNYKFNVNFQRHLFSSKMKLPTSNVKDLWFREIHKRKLYRFIHVGSAFF